MESESHWWKASTLTTTPSLTQRPCPRSAPLLRSVGRSVRHFKLCIIPLLVISFSFLSQEYWSDRRRNLTAHSVRRLRSNARELPKIVKEECHMEFPGLDREGTFQLILLTPIREKTISWRTIIVQ